MKKKIFALISVILSTVMILQSVPVAALADTINTEDNIVSLETATDNVEEKENLKTTSYILGEVTDERTEDTKIFRMNDGSYTAAVYPTQVHYEKDGVMEEIDYSFEEVTVSGEEFYETKEGPVTVRVPQTIDEQSEVLFISNGESISFTLSGIEDIEASPAEKAELDTARLSALKETIDFNSLTAEEFEEQYDTLKAEASVLSMNIEEAAEEIGSIMMKVPGAVGSVGYSSVMNGIDLNYSVSGRTLKEEIVLNRRATALKTFTFTLDCGDLSAVLCEDGSVSIRTDDGNEKFVIQAPFMYDALGAESTDIGVTLTANTDGTYTYTLAPDKAWVASGARLYPIVIDPPVTDSNSSTVIDTTGVFGNNIGNLDENGEPLYLKVGDRWDTELQQAVELQAMIQSDLPAALDETTNIVNARMYLYGYRNSIETCATDMQINAYRITSSWSSDNVPIAIGTGNADYTDIIDYVYFNDSEAVTYVPYCFDITEVVQQWHVGTAPNYGIALRGVNVSGTRKIARFYDSLHGGTEGSLNNAEVFPSFIYEYRDSSGVEDYWSFTSVGAGRTGTLGVNNNNGNLVTTHSLVSSTGNNMPVNVSIVYSANSYDYENRTNLGMWRTNYHARIVGCNLTFDYFGDPIVYKYCYIDSDGTRHFLKQEGSEHKDEDGLGLTLTAYTNEQGYNQGYYYKMEDKDHIIYWFDFYGRLIRIIDPNGNYNAITYEAGSGSDSTKNAISMITEGTDMSSTVRITTFTYASDGDVTITSPEGYSVRLDFLSATNRMLQGISYPDGGYTGFVFTNIASGYFPQWITDGNGHAVKLTYISGITKRVSKIEWGTYGQTVANGIVTSRTINTLEQYSFQYAHNHTTITDIEGRKSTVQFNGYGHTIGIVDHTASVGQSFKNGAPGGVNVEEGTENKLLLASKTIYASENRINGGGINVASDINKFSTSAGVEKSYKEKEEEEDIEGNTGKGYMVLKKEYETASNCFIYQNPAGLAQGQYTISAYISTDGATLSGSGVRVAADVYTNSSYSAGTGSSLVTHTESGEWVRVQATVNVPSGATHILAGISLAKDTIGTVYVDDIQLEHNLSGGAGSFNQLANSSLLNSFSGWSGSSSFSSSSRGGDAPLGLKYIANVTGDPSASKTLYQTVELDGKKGDVFIAGAWGKANSVPVYPLTKDENGEIEEYDIEKYKKKGRPEFGLHVEFYNGATKVGDTFDFQFNSMITSWQFLSEKIIAPDNYTKVKYYFVYAYNTGSASVATPFLYKENYGQSYVYDENGNVISSTDKAETESNFAYQDNAQTESLSPTGSRYMYTYDGATKNLTYAIANSGQRIGFHYNETGDATMMLINDLEPIVDISGDVSCFIVNANDGRALRVVSLASGNSVNCTNFYFDVDNYRWDILPQSNGTYKIRLNKANNLYLKMASGTANPNVINSSESSTVMGTSFKLVANGDGTFRILTEESSYTKALYKLADSAVVNGNGYNLRAEAYDENDPAFKWYLYDVKSGTDKMVTEATYDEDGLRVETSTDADGNTVSYSYGQNGLVSTVTDPKNTVTSYTYDSMNRTTAVESGDSNVEYVYDDDLLSEISVDNALFYKFHYDDYARKTKTEVGNNSSFYTLAEYIYTDNLLTKQKYGTSGTNYIDFTYDNLDRLVKKTYNGDNSKYVQYFYDPNGNQYKVKDGIWGKVTTFDYDLAGRINAASVFDTATMKLRALESIRYNDGKGTVESITHRMFNANGMLIKSMLYNYIYGDPAKGEIPDALYKYEVGTAIDYTFSYDDLARLTDKTLTSSDINRTESYTYKASKSNSAWTTPLVQSMTDFAGVQHVYTYDNNGNILSDTYGGYTVSYEYDSLNRMTRYNDPVYGWTCVYVYDNRGNITEMQEYEYTTATELGEPLYTYEYEYGNNVWADLLTSYYGTDISYDELGNPQNWIWGETLEWENGRQLASYDGSVNYYYNADGLRTGKSGDRNTEYYIVNGTYLGEVTTIGSAQYRIIYLYDETGSVCGIEVTKIDDDTITTDTYYFAKNLQGDVTAILDSQGNVVANYRYDAYGSIISVTDANGNYVSSATHIANLNPFRYRGYMYDEESGFYYLRSRYYDPYIGRFLNADGLVSTGQGFDGNNMFAYCLNCPIMYSDPTGFLAFPGEIHNEVVRRIAEKNGYNKEQRINYSNGKWGRADLISNKGEVWEVKRDKPNQIENGKTQLNNYISNEWKNNPTSILSKGGYIEGGEFTYTRGYTDYHVTYRYAGDGVIAYDYDKSFDTDRLEVDAQYVAESFVVPVLLGALSILAGLITSTGTAAPVTIPAN
ncbi:MAG: DNRLRE domain-containing protein [Clostridia bacterium]|nr:DNRLRE domain-containing protein [Clostridia bacterium]